MNNDMNRKISSMYLRMVMTAVVLTLTLGIFICYFMLFSGKNYDQLSSYSLATSADTYVNITDGKVEVNDKYMNRLINSDIWLLVINKEGKSIYEHNVPEDVPREFNMFDLTSYCIKSDVLEGYTLFFSYFDEYEDYGVITGCSSNKVKKISYVDEGGLTNDWLLVLLIFIMTAIVVVTISSMVFSRKISRPVSDIIDNINEIAYGKYVEKEQKSNLFKEVFGKLRKLDYTLKENQRMKEEWIANISHDLNNPLSTIRGYAEMIKCTKYELAREEVFTYASEIQKAEKNMRTLIEDLKTNQKLKEGKLNLDMSVEHINEIIYECIEEVESIKGESTIDFNPTDDIKLKCDRNLMKRSLQNIIYNAFVHNQDKIVLHIEIKKSNEDKIEISIEDNGKGIEKNDIVHIFERYYRGSRSKKKTGTGLGLAISKEIIEAHGGRIGVESEENEGTKFNIFL